MIRAIIFDFDGLILDTESPIYQSWTALYHQYGVDLPLEEWGQIIGMSPGEHFDPLEKLEERLGRELDREPIKARRRQQELELIAAQPVLPGVETYLKAAQQLGLKLGIASSSSRQWVGGHLRRLALWQYFDVVHTSDDVQRTKPDPSLYHLVLESLNLDARQAIVLEDSPHGVTAAKAAGIFCVAVPNPLTRQLPLDHADLQLNSLLEMPLETLIEKARQQNATGQ